MKSAIKKLLILCLACIMLTALALPVSADAIVSPEEYVTHTPIGWILAVILIAVVVVITILLIRRFFGKKK